MSARPVFVVGFHRSGTTLLHALIGAHPRIAAPPEIGFYARVWARRQQWGELDDDATLRAVVTAALDRQTLTEAGFDVDRVVARAAAGPRTYAGVFAAILDDFADRQGKPRWCEKTPLQPPSWLWEQFADAQLVHVVRDPRDSIASHAALPWDTPPPVALARRWRGFTDAAMREGERRGADAYLRVRHEDLTADPPAVLAGVFAFLGEEFDPAVIDDPARRRATVMPVATQWLGKVLEPITPAPRDGWRTALRRTAQLRVAPVLDPLLAPLGYTRQPAADRVAGRLLNAAAAPGEGARAATGRIARRLRG